MLQIAQTVAIHTLGRFAIVVDGRTLGESMHLPHKPVELLLALVALGGHDVGTALLIEAVWPDQGSLDPRNLLDNTLHRLRGLLGRRDALTVNDGRVSLAPTCCWIDTWAFERLTTELQAGTSAAVLRRQILDLYRGPFLHCESPRPWLIEARSRLHARFIRTMLGEGDRLEAAQDWAAAADWYAAGVEVDPLAPELQRRLARCRTRQDQPRDSLPTP